MLGMWGNSVCALAAPVGSLPSKLHPFSEPAHEHGRKEHANSIHHAVEDDL